MKDIYSPLDIDEEWDNMEPMVDAPAMPTTEGATAVAVKPEAPVTNEDTVSTLPPTMEAPAADTDTKESTAEDAAFTVANADMGMNNTAANTDDKLNINEINPGATAAAPSAEMAMPGADEMPKADTKEATATPVPVIDMNAATNEMKDSGDNGIKVGESFTPEEKPAEDRFEGMDAKKEKPAEEVAKEMPEAKEKAEPQEPAAAELPVTPSDNKDVSKFSKSEMKFDMGEENPKPEVSNSRLQALMTEWEDMKKRTKDRLNDLRAEKDAELNKLENQLKENQAKLENEIKEKQDQISAAQAERDDIDARLNELV